MGDKTINRVKNMMYTQQIEHLPAHDFDKLINAIEQKITPKKYAAILHDKDVNDKGQAEAHHIHVMMSFDNARSINNIAKQLGDKPQYIEAWKGDARNGYAYLIHATNNARMKYQYDVSEVRANFDYPGMLSEISKSVVKAEKYGDSSKIKVLLDLLYTGDITVKELENQLTGAQYGKAHREINAVLAKRLERLAEEWRAEMIAKGEHIKVIWIYGSTGTGKTRFAKERAIKRGVPFCMAGSSRDKFQNYAGEHTLILDELRPRDIPYHDLLRITDPFGVDVPVMAPARYSDKSLACDLIIITSPYDPFSFYHKISSLDRSVDDFEQLHRRISLTIAMTLTEISVAEYSPKARRYISDSKTSRRNHYSSANCPVTPTGAEEIFKEMFD